MGQQDGLLLSVGEHGARVVDERVILHRYAQDGLLSVENGKVEAKILLMQ